MPTKPTTYYTSERGLKFFLECVGNAFEGRYELKISDVGGQAIKSLASGRVSWVWDKPRPIPKRLLNQMLTTKVTRLDEWFFRCGPYTWCVSVTRTTALPPQNPVFANFEEAQEYFSQIKQTYTVIDQNVTGAEDTFSTYDEAWRLYCKTVTSYLKFFPSIRQEPGKKDVYVQRFDLPDPLRPEPIN